MLFIEERPMRYALQIYGVFRTWQRCLPQLLSYLGYHRYPYDVFILSEKNDGYSPESEAQIRTLLGHDRVVSLKYIEDYPSDIHDQEERLYQKYQQASDEARQKIQPNLKTNTFVTRLWYRRWLNNQQRIEYEKSSLVSYDWVIRTRFDIGFRLVSNQPALRFLDQSPKVGTIYIYPDVLSCGSPSVINQEAELIHHWPYMYQHYLTTGSMCPELDQNPEAINQWLLMSEMNLTIYLRNNQMILHELPHDLKIIRAGDANELKTTSDLGSEKIMHVYYGNEDHWVEVTQAFVEQYLSHYDPVSQSATMKVGNYLTLTDPYPYHVKKLVIQTSGDNEYIYPECNTMVLKYAYVTSFNCSLRDIQRITYGRTYQTMNVTLPVINLIENGQVFFHVSNHLIGYDPCPGIQKQLQILTYDGLCYQFMEYTFVKYGSFT